MYIERHRRDMDTAVFDGRSVGEQVMEDDFSAFLAAVKERTTDANTVRAYARELKYFQQWLPEEKHIDQETLEVYQQDMIKRGVAARTINRRVSVVNNYILWMNRAGFQPIKGLKAEKKPIPELTRDEFVQMLKAALTLENQLGYYLLRLFGEAGLRVKDVLSLTVREVRLGYASCGRGKQKEIIRFPLSLRNDLLAYAEESGLQDEQIVCMADGKAYSRAWINMMLREIARKAKVSEEKATPKSLRQMFQRTYDGIRSNVDRLVEQEYNRMLEQEHSRVL